MQLISSDVDNYILSEGQLNINITKVEQWRMDKDSEQASLEKAIQVPLKDGLRSYAYRK